jgi:hypothetical protein
MDLAALDRGVGAEGAANDFAQRLGAVDDEQAAGLRVEPALDQIVDQRLDDSGIFGSRPRPGRADAYRRCRHTPSLSAQGGNAAPSFSTSAGTSANFLVGRFVDGGLTGQPAS